MPTELGHAREMPYIYHLVLILYEHSYTGTAALQYIPTAILMLLAILPREPLPPVKNRTLGT